MESLKEFVKTYSRRNMKITAVTKKESLIPIVILELGFSFGFGLILAYFVLQSILGQISSFNGFTNLRMIQGLVLFIGVLLFCLSGFGYFLVKVKDAEKRKKIGIIIYIVIVVLSLVAICLIPLWISFFYDSTSLNNF